jgi:hypothetical protein
METRSRVAAQPQRSGSHRTPPINMALKISIFIKPLSNPYQTLICQRLWAGLFLFPFKQEAVGLLCCKKIKSLSHAQSGATLLPFTANCKELWPLQIRYDLR